MSIIYDANKIKVFEATIKICSITKKSEDWITEFWSGLLVHPEIYEEFVYYLTNNELLGKYAIGGYTILDLFIWQMDRYQLLIDSGKNETRCSKEDLILNAFYHMCKMGEDLEGYKKKLDSADGMDKL